jgi:hypothetical protein
MGVREFGDLQSKRMHIETRSGSSKKIDRENTSCSKVMNWYCRSTNQSFIVEKPNTQLSIGVDMLPISSVKVKSSQEII